MTTTRSLLLVLPVVTVAACAGNALGGMTARGSRICDSNRDTIAGVGVDANYTLASNSDKLIYCAAVTDSNCDSRTGEGGMTLQYRVAAGSWATLPTSNGSGPFLASSGTDLSNDNSVSSGERRCNSDGGFVQRGKEFTTSTNLDYSSDWENAHTESQWALDFSTSPNDTTYEFRVRWGTKDCNTVTVNYPAQITTAPAGGGGSRTTGPWTKPAAAPPPIPSPAATARS